MNITKLVALGVLVSQSYFFIPAARAEEASTSPVNQIVTSSSSFGDWIKTNGRASYNMWITGMRTEALSGNRDGTGTNLTVLHTGTVGASVGKGYTIKLAQGAYQYIDELDEQEKRGWQPVDPYLSLSQGKIMESERFLTKLEGSIRYYIPISRNTYDAVNRGSSTEAGRGQVRVYLTPVKGFLDGKLVLNLMNIANFRLNSLSPQERFDRSSREVLKTGKGKPQSFREDMWYIFYPNIAYSISPKVDLTLEYATGYLRHTTDGKWSSTNHPDDGAWTAFGVSWSPTKKVNINPYISYQLSALAKDRGITKMDLGLIAGYTFL